VLIAALDGSVASDICGALWRLRGCGYCLALVLQRIEAFNSTARAGRTMSASTFAMSLRRYKNTLRIE
jgi:hypothetical protein